MPIPSEAEKLVRIGKQGVPDVGYCNILSQHNDVVIIEFNTTIKWFEAFWSDKHNCNYHKMQIYQTPHSGYCDVPYDPKGNILTEIDFIGFPKDEWLPISESIDDDIIIVVFLKRDNIC